MLQAILVELFDPCRGDVSTVSERGFQEKPCFWNRTGMSCSIPFLIDGSLPSFSVAASRIPVTRQEINDYSFPFPRRFVSAAAVLSPLFNSRSILAKPNGNCRFQCFSMRTEKGAKPLDIQCESSALAPFNPFTKMSKILNPALSQRLSKHDSNHLSLGCSIPFGFIAATLDTGAG